MFKSFEWMLALRYLRARRQEGFMSVIAWFSLFGIALGVATLIIVMSVMNGFRADLMDRILGFNGHLSVYAGKNGLTGYERIVDTIRKMPDVLEASPLVEGQVMALHKGISTGAFIRGFKMQDLKRHKMISDNILIGSLDDLRGRDALVIGSRLARNLGLTVGNRITLISPRGNVTAFGIVPRVRTYKIVAIFEIGMYEYDSSFIFMPLEAAQTYFRLQKNRVSAIKVMVKDPNHMGTISNSIANLVIDHANIFDWRQSNSSFFNALHVERNVMFLILTLIILIAAFNIISSMIMLVKDKSRDIAILRTMGASSTSILRIFVIAGASIGFIGTFIGFWLGMVFCWNIEEIRQGIELLTGAELFSAEIYFLSKLPAKIDLREVMMIVFMGLSLSFLATLYPSWRAARLDPVEALRYE